MKDYMIRFSPASRADMEAVWDSVYDASLDYDTADRYVMAFTDSIIEKKKALKTGIPLCYRGLFTGYYSVNYKAYKAFYRIKDDTVEVLRILLSKSDYMKVLFGEENL